MSHNTKKRPEMGKWALWKFFASVRSIRSHLPETNILTRTSLERFLSKHRTVYVKPNYGQCGYGVIKVRVSSKGYAFIREHGNVVRCKSLDELFSKIKSPYVQIIQKSIKLAKIHDRPCDIRVLMMRNARRKWQCVGMLTKVAGDGWIITNKRGNGTVLTVEETMQQSLGMDDTEIQTVKDEMKKLGYAICKRFDDYNLYRQIGIDMGIDRDGNIWIIEENTGPGWTLFKRIKDKSMYRTIQSVLSKRGNLVTTRS